MMKFIDTHTHLYDEAFNSDIDQAVERAKMAGVSGCILPAIDMDNQIKLLSLSDRYPGYLYPCTGLHPTSVNSSFREELQYVYDCSCKGGFCAIGEIGIDGYWSRDFIREQMEVFESQLRLASKLNLPVIIHSREATDEIFEVLRSVRGESLRGVFHAFSGSFETFIRYSEYGDFMIGIGGIATYKNSKLPETLKKIPLDRILLETDSPWLTPSPHRGKRNEPSFIPLIAATIAQAKGCTAEDVAAATTQNAEKLFGIKFNNT